MEIPVTREDLAVLVAMLQHEHFPYNDRGAAGARALKALEQALVEWVCPICGNDERACPHHDVFKVLKKGNGR